MARKSQQARAAAAPAAREPVHGVVRKARRLVTLQVDWPGWERGGTEAAISEVIGADTTTAGMLVRAFPPAGTSAERIDEVRQVLAGAGVTAARFMPCARAEGIGVAKARREQPTRLRPRDVVMELCERSASARKPELGVLLDEILTGVGL